MKLTWLQILLILIVGFFLGIAFDKFGISKCHCWKSSCKSFDLCKSWKCCKHKNMKKYMLENLSSELKLTEEQKTQVGTIFDDKHKKVMELKAEIRPKFEALHKSVHNEISKVLTPDQKKKFDEMDAKFEALRKKMHSAAFEKE